MKNQKGFIEIAALVLAAAAAIIGIGGLYVANHQAPAKPVAQFGATGSPAVQAQPFYLSGSGITANATTVKMTSFTLSDQVTPITISMFGSGGTGYATLEPGTVREENISFTGITQNADGTAYLTNVTRGLTFSYPCVASSTLTHSHAGGTMLVLSNSSCFYSNFLTAQNDASITGKYEFSQAPLIDTESTNASSAITYHQLASTSIAGAVPATNANAGIVKIATGTDLANGNTTTTYSLVPDATLFSSSSKATIVPVTTPSGTISVGFINGTSPNFQNVNVSGTTILATITSSIPYATTTGTLAPLTIGKGLSLSTGTLTNTSAPLFNASSSDVVASTSSDTVLASTTLPTLSNSGSLLVTITVDNNNGGGMTNGDQWGLKTAGGDIFRNTMSTTSGNLLIYFTGHITLQNSTSSIRYGLFGVDNNSSGVFKSYYGNATQTLSGASLQLFYRATSTQRSMRVVGFTVQVVNP